MAITVASTAINAWNTTTSPKTGSVTVANGDLLVILCATGATGTTWTASGGSPALTYTSRVLTNGATFRSTNIITAPSTSAQTFTLSVTRNISAVVWGCIALVLSGTDASPIGNTASFADATFGTESTTLTTTAANSAIVVILTDGDSGFAVTWSSSPGTFTPEGTTNSTQSNYQGIFLNAGAIGSKTVGLSPSPGAASNISALEIKTAVLATANPRRPLFVNQAAKRASYY
jgi:hypothetical protein